MDNELAAIIASGSKKFEADEKAKLDQEQVKRTSWNKAWAEYKKLVVAHLPEYLAKYLVLDEVDIDVLPPKEQRTCFANCLSIIHPELWPIRLETDEDGFIRRFTVDLLPTVEIVAHYSEVDLAVATAYRRMLQARTIAEEVNRQKELEYGPVVETQGQDLLIDPITNKVVLQGSLSSSHLR